MTHPGPTTFGEDRHLSTWEGYRDKQATNKQTFLELEYYEKLFKLFTLFYILMRIHIYDFIVLKLFELRFLAKRSIIYVNKIFRPATTIIRYTKIEHVRFPLYYTIRTYTRLYELFE